MYLTGFPKIIKWVRSIVLIAEVLFWPVIFAHPSKEGSNVLTVGLLTRSANEVPIKLQGRSPCMMLFNNRGSLPVNPEFTHNLHVVRVKQSILEASGLDCPPPPPSSPTGIWTSSPVLLRASLTRHQTLQKDFFVFFNETFFLTQG